MKKKVVKKPGIVTQIGQRINFVIKNRAPITRAIKSGAGLDTLARHRKRSNMRHGVIAKGHPLPRTRSVNEETKRLGNVPKATVGGLLSGSYSGERQGNKRTPSGTRVSSGNSLLGTALRPKRNRKGRKTK